MEKNFYLMEEVQQLPGAPINYSFVLVDASGQRVLECDKGALTILAMRGIFHECLFVCLLGISFKCNQF